MGKELLTEKEIKDIKTTKKIATKGMMMFWSILMVVSFIFVLISASRFFAIILIFASCTS